MKLSRLIETVMLLLNRQTVTAKELAGRFEVSVRTVYRDIEDLSAAGIPVYMSKGKGGGISLLEEYTVNKAVLSESECENLAVALKTVQAVKYPEIDTVLEKIGAVFKNSGNSDWIKIDFAGWGSSPKIKKQFSDVKNAILRNNVINFDYINSNGEKTNRYVEPEQLYFNRHTWYLLAFCRNRNEHRIFRMSRVKNITVTDEQFEKRNISDKENTEIQEYSKPFVDLRLRFHGKMLYRIYDNFDEDCIVQNADGSYDVRVSFPIDEWIYGFILSFGHYVEVIEPQFIRDAVAESIRTALKIYEK
jgi:predicted DNA-binding transcriptional regulator YafY